MKPIIRKTTFEEDIKHKDAYFLSLSYEGRQEILEYNRRLIWGDKYDLDFKKGQKVLKKDFF